MGNQEHYTLQGSILRETTKAIQFSIESINGSTLEETKTEWFPLSQVKSILRTHSHPSEEQDNLVVSRWIMAAKELI